MVVLENQFGPTDHTHLGQVMTYVALRDRAGGRWIRSQTVPAPGSVEWVEAQKKKG